MIRGLFIRRGLATKIRDVPNEGYRTIHEHSWRQNSRSISSARLSTSLLSPAHIRHRRNQASQRIEGISKDSTHGLRSGRVSIRGSRWASTAEPRRAAEAAKPPVDDYSPAEEDEEIQEFLGWFNQDAKIPDELPVSPYMVTSFKDAKERHRRPKAPPSKEPTAFQKQLARNPYAQALATPMRYCQMMNVRLPSFFMDRYGLMAHPETNQPWWVPIGQRMKRQSTSRKESAIAIDTGQPDLQHESPDTDSAAEESTNKALAHTPSQDTSTSEQKPEHASNPSNAANIPQSPRHIGSTSYILSRQILLTSVEVETSGFHNWLPNELISPRMHQRPAMRRVARAAKWRADMASFMLSSKRWDVLQEIQARAARGVYFVAAKNWDEAKAAKTQGACILWLGESEHVPEFATVDIRREATHESIGKWKEKRSPVHNLRTLLGEEHLLELRSVHPVFKSDLVVVRGKRFTMNLQMKLWNLQGFLAPYESHFDGDEWLRRHALLKTVDVSEKDLVLDENGNPQKRPFVRWDRIEERSILRK